MRKKHALSYKNTLQQYLKYPALLLLLFLPFTLLHSQPIAEKTSNMFRPGDKLIKQQVEYKEPGESGENVLWDFSRQESINDYYELAYFSEDNDSTIIGCEHRTMYRYKISGDSLFCLGYENPTTRMNFVRPELLIIFPFHYQSRSHDYFYGTGEYSRRLGVILQGSLTSYADAYGSMVIPEGDTLKNVLRVRSVKSITEKMKSSRWRKAFKDTIVIQTDTIDYRLANDSILIELETYKWYAEGYRYPVFETIQSTVYRHKIPAETFNTSFYYTPIEQYYGLDEDPENAGKKEQAQEKTNRKGKSKDKKTDPTPGSSNIQYTINQNKNKNSIELDYQLLDEAEVEIMLFDMQGRLLEKHPKRKQAPGSYQVSISVVEYGRGEYLLHLKINEEIIAAKIAK